MAFQSISAFSWLLPLAGIIILLYLLKMRRQDVRVPAVFLWPSLTADIRANAPFQKLRISLLLILQLLALTLLVCALANPLRQTRGLHGKATVVVLDASGSMGATDVAPSRFEVARGRIASIIASMGTGDHLALIEAGATTRVVFPLSSSKAKMTAALRGIQPGDSPNDMGEALRLASALVGQRPGSRIVVLSDGSFPPVTDFSPGKAELLFDKIGVNSRNLAITAFDSSVTPNGERQVFAGVHNYDSAEMKAKLVFTVDGHIADARSIDIPPKHTIGETLVVSAAALRAEARLVAPDDVLKADNQAALFLQGGGTIRTLLVTPGNLFFERALSLEPNIRLDRATAVPEEEKAGTTAEGRYDLVIFDGVAPVPVKAPAVWSFGGIGPELAVRDIGLSPRPRVVSWKRDNPILSHVDLTEILIEKSHKVQQSSAGNVLLTGSDGPLMVASEASGQRKLYVAWNLMDSDFPLRVGFPIFVGNAVSWLTGQARVGTAHGINARVGQPFSVASPPGAQRLTLQAPDGGHDDLDASSGTATIRSADTVGDYVLTGPKSKTEIAVNLLNDAESEITPRTAIDLSGRSVASRESSVVLTELWRPIILLVLLLLAGEWWLFVRRS